MLLPLAPHELAEIILELELVPLFQLGLDPAMEHELELELVEGLGTLLVCSVCPRSSAGEEHLSMVSR
jgi:hypothetical protein